MKREHEPDPDPTPQPGNRRGLLAGFLPIALVLTAYVWLVSIGTWTHWPAPSDYYDRLAGAFSHGHLWLEGQPDPALLALPDPYDPAQRKDVTFLPDASLYRGRYYLYFGPLPALLILAPKLIIPGVIGDQILVFAFTSATFLMISIFLLRLRKQFFPGVSPFILGCTILSVGLTSPFGWILGSRASVHDAAIAAGQFFFLAGLYMAFEVLDGDAISTPKSILAGACWAAAAASRITQIVPIGLTLTLILIAVIQRQRANSTGASSCKPVLAFVLPLALGLMALGWYNWARFGSVLESGLSYQLALLDLHGRGPDIFSIRSVLQNLYNYLLMAPKLQYNFPYVWPQMGLRISVIPGLPLPTLYFAEQITGVVYTAPSLLLMVAALIAHGIHGAPGKLNTGDSSLLRWLEVTLFGSFAASFAVFLLFFWASERYLLDFFPAALLLAMLGFWHLAETLRGRPWVRLAFISLALALMLISDRRQQPTGSCAEFRGLPNARPNPLEAAQQSVPPVRAAARNRSQ